MTINFYVGGESIQKFTLYGKHGVEEAYLLEGLAQIVRIVLLDFSETGEMLRLIILSASERILRSL